MPTNLEQPHGDTIAYSAISLHIEAVDTLMDLYGKGFSFMTKRQPVPDGLLAEIAAAQAEVEQTRQRHKTTKTWALQEAKPAESAVGS